MNLMFIMERTPTADANKLNYSTHRTCDQFKTCNIASGYNHNKLPCLKHHYGSYQIGALYIIMSLLNGCSVSQWKYSDITVASMLTQHCSAVTASSLAALLVCILVLLYLLGALCMTVVYI